jgi:hypothetical protein
MEEHSLMSSLGFYRQKRLHSGDRSWWGVKSYATRQQEDKWAEELAVLLPTLDPDEFEPIKGKAMKNLGVKQRGRGIGVVNTVVYPSEFPEIPTYAVIRVGKTTARVINTLTGMKVTAPLPIQKACNRAKQLNGDTA